MSDITQWHAEWRTKRTSSDCDRVRRYRRNTHLSGEPRGQVGSTQDVTGKLIYTTAAEYELSLNTVTKCIVRLHDSGADASCLLIALSIVLTDALVIALTSGSTLLSKT
jgi:hypothetical protein